MSTARLAFSVVAALSLGWAASIVQADPAALLDGNRLLALDKGDADHTYLTGFSAGYLMGHQQGVEVMRAAAYVAGHKKAVNKATAGLNLSCPPLRVTGDQAALVLLRWLERHPARLHESARVLAIDAFAEAWPCP